jgi:hypothetical protein
VDSTLSAASHRSDERIDETISLAIKAVRHFSSTRKTSLEFPPQLCTFDFHFSLMCPSNGQFVFLDGKDVQVLPYSLPMNITLCY